MIKQLNYGKSQLDNVSTHSVNTLIMYVVDDVLIGNEVRSCCFSSDGKLIASASWDFTIRLWNIEERKCIKTLMDDTYVIECEIFLMFKVLCCSFPPNDEFIVSSGYDNTVKVWSVDTGMCF